jgi:hypothetical protein
MALQSPSIQEYLVVQITGSSSIECSQLCLNIEKRECSVIIVPWGINRFGLRPIDCERNVLFILIGRRLKRTILAAEEKGSKLGFLIIKAQVG